MEILKFQINLALPASLVLILFINNCVSAPSFRQVDICREVAQNNSKPFCSCNNEVISCDFSSFSSNDQEFELQLNGWNDNMNSNIKRLCFCGGPSNLHLALSPNIVNGLRQLHRVDLFNITGVVHIRKAFSKYFSGDLYMYKTRINSLHPLSFAGGGAFTIEDVSSRNCEFLIDLECCSKIKLPLKHLSHPVFYMEKSAVGLIYTNGIHDDHVWNTLIWKDVLLRAVEPYGILLETPGMNVSITGCIFNGTKESAVMIKRAANVLLTMNTFTNTSHFEAFHCKSSRPNSNLVLLENFFNNEIVLNLDASKIIGLFNRFDLWDNYTFLPLNLTLFKDRKILMSANTADKIGHFDENSMPVGSPAEIRYFYANTLGMCSCDESAVKLPNILTNTRCEYRDSAKGVCNPLLAKVSKSCGSDGSKKFTTDCYYEEKALPKIPMNHLDLIEAFLRKYGSDLNSPFIDEQLQFSPYHYHVPMVGQRGPLVSDLFGRNKSSKNSSGASAIYIFILWTLSFLIYGIK